MQDLEVKDAILKIKKTKTGIKKDLKNSIVNSKRIENVDIQDKVNGCISNEDTIKTIQEFEQITQNKKSYIVWSGYHQGQICQKFTEKERFVSDMNLNFNVSKSTIVFKIALKNKLMTFQNKSLIVVPSLFFLKNLKLIKEVCKDKASEFK